MVVRCPCCDAERPNRFTVLDTTLAKRPLRLPLWRCDECGHAWLQTGEAHGLIEEDYDSDYLGHRIDVFLEAQFRAAIQSDIRPLRPPPASLLDVGCGNGSFLLTAQEAGYQAVGIDISAGAVDIVKDRGGKALAVDFLTHDFGQTFDIISMWDVVEHLRDPFKFFQRARDLLSPGGVLVIKTPSFGKPLLDLTRARNRCAGGLLTAPHHVQFWTQESIAAIMNRAGFADVVYWPSRSFHSVPETKSVPRIVRRWIRTELHRLTGSRNIYCAGRLS